MWAVPFRIVPIHFQIPPIFLSVPNNIYTLLHHPDIKACCDIKVIIMADAWQQQDRTLVADWGLDSQRHRELLMSLQWRRLWTGAGGSAFQEIIHNAISMLSNAFSVIVCREIIFVHKQTYFHEAWHLGPGLMMLLLQSVAAFVGLFRKKIKCPWNVLFAWPQPGPGPAAAQRKWNMIIKSTNGKTRKDEKHNQRLDNNSELPQEKTELREQFCKLCYISGNCIYPSPFVFPVTIKVCWYVFSSNFPRH